MKLKVIGFNIRCCDDADGHSIAERAPRLFSATAPYDADIIGFQECRAAWEPQIEKYFGEKYDMFFKYRNETEDVEASPILWRRDKFCCVKTGYFWLSDTPQKESRGWDEMFNCYRMCVFAVLKDKQSGEQFTVMNTHFGFGDSGQVKSARLIKEQKEKYSCGSTFILGDFNMTPESAGFSEMTKSFRDANACTINDRRSTFHNYCPEKTLNQHIDYCFIDETITPLDFKIITDTFDGKYPSDHFGLYILLETAAEN